MGKVIAIPNHIVAAGDQDAYFYALNNYSNKIGTLTRDGDTIIVTGISLDRINTVLGGMDSSLHDLSDSPDINPYSYYRPSNSTPAKGLGEFAGYHHLAKPPTWITSRYETFTANVEKYFDAHAGILVYRIWLYFNLKRGERLPFYCLSPYAWNGIKVVVSLHQWIDKNAGTYQSTPVYSQEFTNIDVTSMNTMTQVDGYLELDNVNGNYAMVLRGQYTYSTSLQYIEDDPVVTDLTVNKINPYDLLLVSEITEPIPGDNNAGPADVKNNAPALNSESYTGPIKTLYTYTNFSGATVNMWATSGSYTVDPQQTVTFTASFPQYIPLEDVDTTKSRSVTLYYVNDQGTNTYLGAKEFLPTYK